MVHRELTKLMGEANVGLDLATQPPAVILMAGLQGSGKTTTTRQARAPSASSDKKKVAAGLARRLPPGGDRAAEDRCWHRPRRSSLPSDAGEKPVDIARRAVDYARTHYQDVLIVDTAGRLAIDEEMMREIAELHAALKPVETLFVVDAMQGQDAVNVARAFNERLPLTGVVLTKLDGDARGGAALSVRHVTGKPIKFAGVAEKLDGLEPFHPERMAARILGMGDILSLVEEAHAKIDLEEAQRVAEKVKKGKGFDLEDFKQQIVQMKKMGGVASLMDKLPAQLVGQIDPAKLQDEKQFKRIEGIINSMTPARAPQARADQGLAQAPHRRRRRRPGAGGQPAAQPVRADAEDDEDDERRQFRTHDARNEGHASGHALGGGAMARLRPHAGVQRPVPRHRRLFAGATSTEQVRLKQRFNRVMASALGHVEPDERVVVDTGDGAAITFLGDPERALFVALEVFDNVADLPVRMGINLGPVSLMKDLNDLRQRHRRRHQRRAAHHELRRQRRAAGVARSTMKSRPAFRRLRGACSRPKARAATSTSARTTLYSVNKAVRVGRKVASEQLKAKKNRRAGPDSTFTPIERTPAQVFDAGTHYLVSGYSKEGVNAAVEKLVAKGAKLISPLSQVGSKWLASVTNPKLAVEATSRGTRLQARDHRAHAGSGPAQARGPHRARLNPGAGARAHRRRVDRRVRARLTSATRV